MLCYHGSPIAGIETLSPPPGKVLYLTPVRAYALFYIRDLAVNHVTCGVLPGGVVRYDEQLPGSCAHSTPGAVAGSMSVKCPATG